MLQGARLLASHRLTATWYSAVRLRDDRSGIALVEFAILCPILLLLYLCGAQYSDAIACSRKVTTTARAITDLTSQYASMTASQVDTVLAASAQIMAPYAAGNAMVRVTVVKVNGSGKGVVQWSRALNGSPQPNGAKVVMPVGLQADKAIYIYSEVQYGWTPVFGLAGVITPHILSEQFFMLPRVSSTVDCNDC